MPARGAGPAASVEELRAPRGVEVEVLVPGARGFRVRRGWTEIFLFSANGVWIVEDPALALSRDIEPPPVKRTVYVVPSLESALSYVERRLGPEAAGEVRRLLEG